MTTSLDTNWDPEQRWAGLVVVLETTTVFLPNYSEAKALTEVNDVNGTALILARSAEIVAVKQSASGALCASGADIFIASVIPVEVTDTVGAGDTFDAGFIYGYLNNWGLEESLKLAISCGSLSAQGAGGIISQPTLQEAKKAIVNHFGRNNNARSSFGNERGETNG